MYSQIHSSYNQDHQVQYPSKPIKKRLTKDQIKLLETSFDANHKLKQDLKLELARQLGLPPKQVAIWYQNRRARYKTNTIESDYKNMQQELDNVLAENVRLEKEVDMLKFELNKAQQMLPLVSAPSSGATNTTLPCMSASSEDHASSSSPANMIWSGDDVAGDFQFDELCTGYIGSDECPLQKQMFSWLN